MSEATAIEWVIKAVAILIAAVWLYRDARSRDYYWLMWAIAPAMLLFLSGIAWIVALVLIIAVYTGVKPRGALLFCPHCKKRVHDELAFCPFCKRSVKRECLRCHRTVPWDAQMCPHCRSSALTDS